MGLFRRKSPEQRMKELDEKIAERREEEKRLFAEIDDFDDDDELWDEFIRLEKEYLRPSSPTKITVLENNTLLEEGVYDVWRCKDKLIFTTLSSKDRDGYYGFPFGSPNECFSVINIKDVVGVSTEGERREETVVTGGRIANNRRIKLETKDIVKDSRKAALVIRHGSQQVRIMVLANSVSELESLIADTKGDSTSNDYMETLNNLKELYDKGILTKEEFDTKKAEILKKI